MRATELKRVLRYRWFPAWLLRLRTHGAVEQAVGLWLAMQADEDGVIEAVDWSQLVLDSGLGDTVVRKSLRPQGRLVTAGLVEREMRAANGRPEPTRYTLVTR